MDPCSGSRREGAWRSSSAARRGCRPAGRPPLWARFEAEERGLVEELAAFPVEDGPVMDALSFADMSTGPAGQPMTLAQRIEEVQHRYWSDDPAHRAIVRARPLLQAAIDRTRQRVDGRPTQPM